MAGFGLFELGLELVGLEPLRLLLPSLLFILCTIFFMGNMEFANAYFIKSKMYAKIHFSNFFMELFPAIHFIFCFLDFFVPCNDFKSKKMSLLSGLMTSNSECLL
jgi:hypothetical protein